MRIVLSVVSRIVSLAPEALVRFTAAALSWFWFYALRIRRGVMLAQLKAAFPELSDDERRVIARGVLRHLCWNALDFLRLPRVLASESERMEYRGLEHLEEAHRLGRGVLVLTAHLGAWETLIASSAQRFPLSIVTKELADRGVNGFVMQMRRRFGVGMFPTRESFVDLLRHLRGNGVIGFVIDQDMPLGRGVFVRFFGRWAATTEGLALLAKASKAPVVPVFAYRHGERHLFDVQPAIEYEPLDDKRRELAHNTARYGAVVEEAIRRAPEQWLWLHRRWKTQPLESESVPDAGSAEDPYLLLTKAERRLDRREA